MYRYSIPRSPTGQVWSRGYVPWEAGAAMPPVLEHNGDLYSCDHFVFPQYRLGNITEHTIIEMMMSERQQRFGEAKRGSLPRQCRECGSCLPATANAPKTGLPSLPTGEPGLNYLCEGYRRYFAHVAPFMDFMKAELDAHRRPPM